MRCRGCVEGGRRPAVFSCSSQCSVCSIVAMSCCTVICHCEIISGYLLPCFLSCLDVGYLRSSGCQLCECVCLPAHPTPLFYSWACTQSSTEISLIKKTVNNILFYCYVCMQMCEWDVHVVFTLHHSNVSARFAVCHVFHLRFDCFR